MYFADRNKLIYLYIQLLILNGTLFYFIKVPQQNWGYQEFLINYSGGFVRRGLPGTILVWINDLSGISPYAIIFLVMGIALNFISFATYCILVSLKNLHRGTFLFIYFNPALILFIGSGDTFVRKDWLITSALLLHALISLRVYNQQIDEISYSKLLIMLGFALGVITLSHEINAYFTLLHIFIVIKNTQFFGTYNARIVKFRNLILFSQIFILGISVYFHGTPELAQIIKDSLPNKVRSEFGLDAINALGMSLNDNFSLVASMFSLQTFVGYLLLTFVGPFLIYTTIFSRKASLNRIILAHLIVIFLVLLISGWDWGRWISLTAFCIIALTPFRKDEVESCRLDGVRTLSTHMRIISGFTMMFLLFCSVTFSIPIGGPRPFYGFDFSIWAQLVARFFNSLS